MPLPCRVRPPPGPSCISSPSAGTKSPPSPGHAGPGSPASCPAPVRLGAGRCGTCSSLSSPQPLHSGQENYRTQEAARRPGAAQTAVGVQAQGLGCTSTGRWDAAAGTEAGDLLQAHELTGYGEDRSGATGTLHTCPGRSLCETQLGARWCFQRRGGGSQSQGDGQQRWSQAGTAR
ncbi:hypothetical protein P7K49_036297 [Saguinus oedipus]|uniref:Uncharacterized protein n=1 Tax=Saguinus oedipus TaxID=9490 RepID=A0ABQ9TLE4_SAGOE|nr:hypothetical protein P7K49_036297 [Saguinus oedipus]